MEVDHHRVDIIRRPAVMVDNADLGNGLQQRLALHLIRTVGIHHDQNAAVVRHQKGILPGNKAVPVLGLRQDLGNQLRCGIVLRINDDAELFAPFSAQAADTHGGACPAPDGRNS